MKSPANPRDAVPFLLKALATETEPYAFRELHKALRAMTNLDVMLGEGREKDATARGKIADEWRNAWAK